MRLAFRFSRLCFELACQLTDVRALSWGASGRTVVYTVAKQLIFIHSFGNVRGDPTRKFLQGAPNSIATEKNSFSIAHKV